MLLSVELERTVGMMYDVGGSVALGTSAIDSGDLRDRYVGRRITRDRTLKRTEREIRARLKS